jgi:arginine decarboxylase
MDKYLINSKKLWKIGLDDYNTQYFDYDSDGNLIIKEGNNIYNINYLIEKLGTPLEIFMPFVVEERVEDLLDIANNLTQSLGYKGRFFYHYPMKVNQNKEAVMALIGEGANIETSSYNELYLIKKMLENGNFNQNIRIVCNGPKTDKYISLIDELQHRGLKITPVIEGPNELKFLQYSRYDVGIRLDMQVEANSRWNKPIDRFGFPKEELYALGICKNLKILHYHIGSQIEDADDMIGPLKYALDVFHTMKKKNPTLDTINIGGGMPIPYERKAGVSLENILTKVFMTLKDESDKHGMPHPHLICEWGRYMIAPAQLTIFKVIDTKSISHPKSQAKKWFVVDGSFINDIPDVWGVDQKFMIAPTMATKEGDNMTDVWLAGSSCDSDDIYKGTDGKLSFPDFDVSESTKPYYLVVFDTGAYQDPLASHHCMLSSPAKIIIQNGHIMMLRKRETADDVGKFFGW